jgi:recombination protein RecT
MATQPSNTAIVKQPIDQIRGVLGKTGYRQQLAIALTGSSIDPEFMVRVAITAIQGDRKLATCDPITIAGSIIQLAQSGLVPDGFMGFAYLIPFWNGKRQVLECKPLIGWRGYVHLGYQSDKVKKFEPQLVYAGDHFDCDLAEGWVSHKPCMVAKDRGPVIAVYAIVKLVTGENLIELMLVDDIEKIRQGAKSADSDAWKNHWDEMARKTVVRRISKRVPSQKAQRAAAMEEAQEAGKVSTSMTDTGEIIFGHVEDEAKEPIAQPQREKQAEAKPAEQPEAKQETSTTQTAEPVQGNNVQPTPAGGDGVEFVEGTKVKKVFALAKAVKMDETKLRGWLKEHFGIEHFNQIPTAKFSEICEKLGRDIGVK